MVDSYRKRRLLVSLFIFIAMTIAVVSSTYNQPETNKMSNENTSKVQEGSAIKALDMLAIKGRAPKTGYSREQFGTDWAIIDGCDMRNIILNRDMTNVITDENCQVLSGMLNDPYTGKTISFVRGNNTSGAVQIDHIVALSDAWQKGAQQLQMSKRVELANDPLELLAVDGSANQKKGDGDAATWLPPNKAFRCQYVARQIAVKQKYNLWITQAEYDTIKGILSKCTNQLLPSP